MSDASIKVAIVDRPLVVSGLGRAFEQSGFDIVGGVTNGADLIELLDQHTCDVVVSNYLAARRDALDGWRFLSSLTTLHSGLPVVVYSEIEDPFLMGSLAQRNVAGIVSKREEIQEVVDAVRAAARGRRYRSPIVEAALDRFSTEREMRRFGLLTPRQMEVIGLMLCGLSIVETSRLLRCGTSTISKRRIIACQQMGFPCEADLLRFVSNHGLSLDRADAAHEFHWA